MENRKKIITEFRNEFPGLYTLGDEVKEIEDFLFEKLQEERENILTEIIKWAKENNMCSDLVSTFDFLEYLEKLKSQEEHDH